MSHQINYLGPAALAGALVQYLEDEGVTVDWTPPVEQTNAEGMYAAVALGIVSNGATAAIKAGVAKFREKFGDHASVEIEGEDDD